MKSGFLLPAALLLGLSADCGAFSPCIASHESAGSGEEPHSIFVPGYGEVVFESGPDPVLVVDSAYASTREMDAPPMRAEQTEEKSPARAAADGQPEFVTISNRANGTTASWNNPSQTGDAAGQNPEDERNVVPEAASATLGLVGTLLLLLRRRMKPTPRNA